MKKTRKSRVITICLMLSIIMSAIGFSNGVAWADPSGYYYTWDGVSMMRATWNGDISDNVLYTHPDYRTYKIGSTSTTTITGNNFKHTQISKNTVSNFSGLSGGVLGGAIGGAVGAYYGNVPGGVVGGVIGAVLGTTTSMSVQSLMDERGCIWVTMDRNPEITSSFSPSTRTTIYVYHYKMVKVGNIQKNDVYLSYAY